MPVAVASAGHDRKELAEDVSEGVVEPFVLLTRELGRAAFLAEEVCTRIEGLHHMDIAVLVSVGKEANLQVALLVLTLADHPAALKVQVAVAGLSFGDELDRGQRCLGLDGFNLLALASDLGLVLEAAQYETAEDENRHESVATEVLLQLDPLLSEGLDRQLDAAVDELSHDPLAPPHYVHRDDDAVANANADVAPEVRLYYLPPFVFDILVGGEESDLTGSLLDGLREIHGSYALAELLEPSIEVCFPLLVALRELCPELREQARGAGVARREVMPATQALRAHIRKHLGTVSQLFPRFREEADSEAEVGNRVHRAVDRWELLDHGRHRTRDDPVARGRVRPLVDDRNDVVEEIIDLAECHLDILGKQGIGDVPGILANRLDRLFGTLHDVATRLAVENLRPPIGGQLDPRSCPLLGFLRLAGILGRVQFLTDVRPDVCIVRHNSSLAPPCGDLVRECLQNEEKPN